MWFFDESFLTLFTCLIIPLLVYLYTCIYYKIESLLRKSFWITVCSLIRFENWFSFQITLVLHRIDLSQCFQTRLDLLDLVTDSLIFYHKISLNEWANRECSPILPPSWRAPPSGCNLQPEPAISMAAGRGCTRLPPHFHLCFFAKKFCVSSCLKQNGCLRALAQMNSSSSAATVPCRPLSSLPSGFHKRMEEDSCMEKRKERKDSLRVEEGLRYAIKSGAWRRWLILQEIFQLPPWLLDFL